MKHFICMSSRKLNGFNRFDGVQYYQIKSLLRMWSTWKIQAWISKICKYACMSYLQDLTYNVISYIWRNMPLLCYRRPRFRYNQI